MSSNRRITALLCSAIVLCFMTALAAESALQFYYNGKKSSMKAVHAKDLDCVPVYFPLTPGDTTYTVTVHYDAKTRKVEIQNAPVVAKKRDDAVCYQCSGTGKCQNDYPPGCGKNTAAESCPLCNATGNCWYCSGTGKSWK